MLGTVSGTSSDHMLSPRVTAVRHVSRAGEGWLTSRAWACRDAWGSASGSPRASRGVGSFEINDLEHLVSPAGAGHRAGAAGAAAGMQSTVRPCSARGWSPAKLSPPGRHRCIREYVQWTWSSIALLLRESLGPHSAPCPRLFINHDCNSVVNVLDGSPGQASLPVQGEARRQAS